MKTNITLARPAGIFLRVVRRTKFLNKSSQNLIKLIISKKRWRKLFNNLYTRLNFDEKEVLQSLYSKTFRETDANVSEGEWTVNFIGKEIKFPLRNESMWLDWDNAISIIGHDTDVKITYETLIKSRFRPKVFFDVGANYGTHSLLFLSQGVSVVSFEPNPDCRKEFEALACLNNLNGTIEGLAVGDSKGMIELWFPEKNTWLGSIVENTKDTLSEEPGLRKIQVPMTTLDDYVEQTGVQPDLIKIDTEGNELNVIKGMLNLVKKVSPIIIFECNSLSHKKDLFEIFRELKYSVCELPLLSKLQAVNLELNDFLSSSKHNFLALPEKHPIVNII